MERHLVSVLTAATPLGSPAPFGPATPFGLAAPLGSGAPFGTVVVLTVAAAAAGAAAGALTRRWLAGLRRGADVPSPWCELATALLWSVPVLWWSLGALPGVLVPLLLGLGWLGVAGSAVDLRHRRLPNALTLPALPLVLALLVPLGADAVLRGVAGAALLAAAHAVVHLVAPAAMGAGDVKLAAPVGAALAGPSWAALPAGAALALVLTGLLAAAGLAGRRWDRCASVPHGPSMLAAAWAVVLFAAGSAGLAGTG
ncbi:prepilin peptidase [Pseudonocardia sp. KRD291]|uniref:prepilin peptidase n=1 Tax=Pseudonocardia sp. KRD291 TaxID=2792007 RepID=UPI001C4A6A5B|nr:prepilin peptidase [Pseudonocardia sp. KRD291]MBW0103504.1 prepilin peptidase [Pseudonocardia sp. KRD291]